jgi:hypothetical protein
LDAFTKAVETKSMNHLDWILVVVPLFILKSKLALTKKYQHLFFAILLLEAVYFMAKIGLTMKHQIDSNPEWDFSWFWIYGKVASQRLNFIDPSNVQQLARSLHYSSEFIDELDFPYLPPTIFLFTWLGYFNFKVAYGIWYILHSIFLILDIVLLKKIFFPKTDFLGWISIAVLLLALSGTLSNFYFGQTHTLLLCLLLLFWQYHNYLRGGAYLALGVLVKPWLIVFLIYACLKRQWTVLIGFLATLGLSFLLTALYFGATPILNYFTKNSLARTPLVYIEPINQSLLSTILRMTQYKFAENSPLTHPVFLVVALALVTLTSYSIFRLKNIDLAFSIILMLSLLIYPGTLAHYSIFLIVPILMICRDSAHMFYGILGAAFFMIFQYVFSSYENLTFIVFLFDWIVLIALSFVWIKKPIIIY